MRLTAVAARFAVFAAAGCWLCRPTPRRRRTTHIVDARGNTVFTSRDEDGKTRTRIIIQKRSYLDPGTETLPGENVGNTSYIQSPSQHASGVIDNTAAGKSESPLPGPFTLPGQEQSLDRILARSRRPAFPARRESRRPFPRCPRPSCPAT